ncbi:hypothetical protein COV20_02985 [Candidatus Woesearchaeota archaeon CG10_big_fil_rev_8_21_14_0_10_45_16]|nr:MAG: hypothetical protein COV20_02985 [Candidatus Woesearchaeota archaeon CG10_big_fil_rev_8_21_14_0_10_45_16]
MKTVSIAALVVILFIPLWLLVAVPQFTGLPEDFTYTADVFSLDNFYNTDRMVYLEQQISKTDFSYEVEKKEDDVLIIKNIFDVRTLTDQKIFSVERLYGIDPKTGKHVSGYGDKDREGYLFAPKNLKAGEPFTYWHINYDGPAQMEFQAVEVLYGLPVYRYTAQYHADQTENLDHLPGVPETRGIDLDINLTLWLEPVTGRMIKYEDDTIAYYYDQATKERLYPWNHFHNRFTGPSVKEQVEIAVTEKQRLFIFKTVVPFLLMIAALSLLVYGLVRTKRRSSIV